MDPCSLGGVKDQSQDSQDMPQTSANDNLNCYPTNRFSLNLNSLSKPSSQPHPYYSSGGKPDFFVPINRSEDPQIVAPPPPGFVDDTDQYYQEDQGDDDRGSGKFIPD